MTDSSRLDYVRRLDYLSNEMSAIYHQSSLRLGISDSVSMVLYTIYDKGAGCLLSDVYKNSGISRQTVNSAIRHLETDGVLYLEPYRGRAKRIVLTEQGEALLQRTAARLFEAELRAFDGWTEEELRTHIGLLEKYLTALRREVERL